MEINRQCRSADRKKPPDPLLGRIERRSEIGETRTGNKRSVVGHRHGRAGRVISPNRGRQKTIASSPIADIRAASIVAIMTPVAPDLRLSAQRALLGTIYPEVRLVKVRRDGSRITFTAICEKPFSDDALDALT